MKGAARMGRAALSFFEKGLKSSGNSFRVRRKTGAFPIQKTMVLIPMVVTD